MWPLFERKYKIGESGILNGYTDWHSHILPGVDDGVRDIEKSLEILERYEGIGVKSVWLTPHIMEDIPNSTDHLRERFAELQNAYNGPIGLNLASENMLDVLFEERLSQNDLLPINGNHLLVETSYIEPPMDLYGLLSRIKGAGYFPILAHPERYRYMSDEDYRRLVAMDVKLQMNLPSAVGMYGDEAHRRMKWLLKNGLYSFIGTDLHNGRMLGKLLDGKISSSLCKSIKTIGHD